MNRKITTKAVKASTIPTRVSIAWQDGDTLRFGTLWAKDGGLIMALTRPRAKGEGFNVTVGAEDMLQVSTKDADLRASHGVRLCHDTHCAGINGTPSHPVTRVKPGRGAITCVTRNTARVARQRVEAKADSTPDMPIREWAAWMRANRPVAVAA